MPFAIALNRGKHKTVVICRDVPRIGWSKLNQLAMNDRLESWKEIAAYLNRNVRTVQRWEQARGLPVQRIPGGKRDLILARKSELDSWWENSKRQLEPEEPRQPAERTRVWPDLRHFLWIAAALASAFPVVWFLVPRDPPAELARKAIPLTSYEGRELEPSFSPDGGRVAFSWNGEGGANFDIYAKLASAEKPLRLTSDPRVDINPVWSPDGRNIAFLREQGIGKAEVMLVRATGGVERKITEVDTLGRSRCSLLAWSRDGKRLIVVHRPSPAEPYGLFSLDPDRPILSRVTDPPAGGRGDSGIAVSPDGRMVAFSRMLAGPGVGDLYLLQLKENILPKAPPVRLTFWNRITVGAAWSFDGRYLIVSSNDTLWRVAVDAPHKADEIQSLGGDLSQPASAPHSRLAFVSRFLDANIWSASVRDGSVHRVIASTRNEDFPQYSPDGHRILYTSDRTGLPGLWLSKRDGTEAKELGPVGDLMPGSPRWSPDGKRVVFGCRFSEWGDLCIMDAAGGRPIRLTQGQAHHAVPFWSHDGKWIYFGSNRGGEAQVWRMPAAGGEEVRITKRGGWAPMESADGRMVYYVKDSGIHSSLWSVPVAGGEEHQVLDSVRARAFTLTRNGIYYVPQPGPDGATTLRFFDFDSRRHQVVAQVSKSGAGLSVSPDGQTVLFTRIDREGSDLMMAERFR
ncbi:MAG: PD40 domain-containing protein [Acidobacteria bacterium]|nr:PD40 domain-containing protein [Acidobacteriota bacterium]